MRRSSAIMPSCGGSSIVRSPFIWLSAISFFISPNFVFDSDAKEDTLFRNIQ